MKFPFKAVLAGPLLFGALAATPAWAIVKFDFGSIDAESYLMMADGKYSKDSYKIDSRLTYKANWSAVTSAALTNAATGIGTASASSTITAAFTSVAAATVKFMPQTTAINVNDPAHGESFAYATANFQYGFTVDAKYTLSYTHSVATIGAQTDGTAIGQTFFFEDSGQTPIYTFYQNNGSSSGSIVLDPGTYYIRVGSNALNWSDYPRGVGSNTTSLNATFAFNLQQGVVPAAVPEPATWAMMAGGFGLAGLAIRRRRPTRADAPAC